MAMNLMRFGVLMMYLFLLLASLGHSLSYFDLVESTGGVATGVIQALRAVGVFGLSHFWFCGTDQAQCFTPWKGVATVVVVTGVVGFAIVKSMEGGAGGVEMSGYDEVTLEDFEDPDLEAPGVENNGVEEGGKKEESAAKPVEDDSIFDL
ncbi:hypothetical protein HDU67_002719 [Dinochytrium kinnereticum]|nr:hypothetical protein HDU67_002719 [Dinochytrium kinnereticum]